MKISIARKPDIATWLNMRKQLWPDTSDKLHLAEIKSMLSSPNKFICFIAFDKDEGIGFIEASIREDIDDGCIIKNIGYVEGWYVKKSARNKEVGKKLIMSVEDWSQSQGCSVIGSDTDPENTTSRKAHCSLGFEEVDIAVHFRKKLNS